MALKEPLSFSKTKSMGFKKHETHIEGLVVVEPSVFPDNRGFFKESWNQNAFRDIGLDLPFVQDNMSHSTRGILRGLHFQVGPHAQGKLVSALKGSVQDVAVDLRVDSPTFGEHYSIELSAENHKMLYIPPGFAHGFLVLSAEALFYYKCTNFYNKEAEGGLMWNDPQLGIEWEINTPTISEKDQKNPLFSELKKDYLQF